MTSPFTHRLRVRYVECDMQGIVFNAHFYTWMDIAHAELLREVTGVPAGVNVVVAESSARYFAPAHFDDELDVQVAVEHLGTTSMITRYTFRRGDEELVDGLVRHVHVDPETITKQPWPDDLRAALAAFTRA